MYAPHGFAKFPGEIYEILLPLYGLTVSSRRFYESLSEFMRALGFQHFAGGDPCLFRRPRNMPTPKEIAANNLAAQKWNLPPRPSGAPPMSPKSSRSGPAPTFEYPYPERFDQPEYKSTPNVRFEPFHSEGLAPDAINGLFAGTYYEMAGAYVDDLLVATHTSAQIADDFVRRFEAKVSPPGNMYLGMDYEQNLVEGWIAIGFKTCLERSIERIKGLKPEDINLRSNAGVLLWVCLHVHGPYLVEVKALTRRVNLNLPEDIKTSTALLYELYERRGARIYFRRRTDDRHDFIPRTSRHDSIRDVSEIHLPVPAAKGEIMVTADDIFLADGNSDVYLAEDEDHPTPEDFAVDDNFRVTVWSDASYAPEGLSRRSDLGHVVFLNNAPLDWDATRMTGVADSSFAAEYCGASRATKREKTTREILHFLGIQPPPATQYCDSTSTTMLAKNPQSLGAARPLGIRMHAVRYAIAHEGLQFQYAITEDMVADVLTKRLPRAKLARFALIFYNNLCWNWYEDHALLQPLHDEIWFPDIRTPDFASDYADEPMAIEDDEDIDDEEEEDGSDGDPVHTWDQSPYNPLSPNFVQAVDDDSSSDDDNEEVYYRRENDTLELLESSSSSSVPSTPPSEYGESGSVVHRFLFSRPANDDTLNIPGRLRTPTLVAIMIVERQNIQQRTNERVRQLRRDGVIRGLQNMHPHNAEPASGIYTPHEINADGQNASGPSMVFIPYLDDTIVSISNGSTLATQPYVNVPYSVLLDDRFSGRALDYLLRDARTREEAVQLELARRAELAGGVPVSVRDARTREEAVQWELARRAELANLDRLGVFETMFSSLAISDANVAGSSRDAEAQALQSARRAAEDARAMVDPGTVAPVTRMSLLHDINDVTQGRFGGLGAGRIVLPDIDTSTSEYVRAPGFTDRSDNNSDTSPISSPPDSPNSGRFSDSVLSDYEFYMNRDEDDPRVVSPPNAEVVWSSDWEQELPE